MTTRLLRIISALALTLLVGCRAAAHRPSSTAPPPVAATAEPAFDGLETTIRADCQSFSIPSHGAGVRAAYCEPPGDSAGLPALIVLHGCGGPGGPPGLAIGPLLASNGIVTLEVHYFAQTPAPRGAPDFCSGHGVKLQDLNNAWPTWKQTLSDSADFLRIQPRVDTSRIGILGWSLGGWTALRAAGEDPRYRAVVSFSGGVSPEIRSEAPSLPPTLILQGDVDASTPVTDAYQLRDALAAAGRTFEIHIYRGEDHNWNGPTGTNALGQTVDFLQRYMAPNSQPSR